MAKKMAIFAFRGDSMCFVHVLLNALDLYARGMGGDIVVEGEATKLLPILEDSTHFLHGLYKQVKEKGLIVAVCKACSSKMGVFEQIKSMGLPLSDEMSGHPSMGRFLEQGFEIIVM